MREPFVDYCKQPCGLLFSSYRCFLSLPNANDFVIRVPTCSRVHILLTIAKSYLARLSSFLGYNYNCAGSAPRRVFALVAPFTRWWLPNW